MSDPKYGSLHCEVGSLDDPTDTNIEVAEPLIGDNEKSWQEFERVCTCNRQSRRRRVWLLFDIARWGLDTCLLLVILVLVIQRQQEREGYAGRYELAGDITGFAPKFSHQIVTFQPDPSYTPENTSLFFSNDTRTKWLDLVPKGLGFLKVEDPAKYDNLPTPIANFSETVFTTSMTHQLHCLHSIVDSYARFTTGRPARHDSWHLQHCFDYLRQSIMCCGDVALEGMETTFPEGQRGGSDGWDAKHICRDYSQVYQYLDTRRVNDDVWI